MRLPLGKHAGNSGGKKGRSGRPSNSLRAALELLRTDPDALEALKRAACNPNSRGFSLAWKLASHYDPERPSDKHHHEVGLSLEQILGQMHEDRRQHEREAKRA